LHFASVGSLVFPQLAGSSGGADAVGAALGVAVAVGRPVALGASTVATVGGGGDAGSQATSTPTATSQRGFIP